jgi:hypothetical protein
MSKLLRRALNELYSNDFDSETEEFIEEIISYLDAESEALEKVYTRSEAWKDHMAEEAECVHMVLDDNNVPRKSESGEIYSLVGRVMQFAVNARGEE